MFTKTIDSRAIQYSIRSTNRARFGEPRVQVFRAGLRPAPQCPPAAAGGTRVCASRVMGSVVAASSEDTVRLLRRRVRHFGHHPALEARYPGEYPKIYVAGDGAYLVEDNGRRVIDGGNHLGVAMIGHGRRDMA